MQVADYIAGKRGSVVLSPYKYREATVNDAKS
jgi:hypothetical protein